MSKIDYKKASTYYFIGNMFNKGMSFLTVPVFSRLLSTADYGIVTTYNSWISILAMVIGLALHMGIRAAFIDYEEKIDDFMSVTTTFTLESGIVLSGMVVVVTLLLRIDISLTLIVLCLLQGLASALVQNYSMYLMMKYKYKFRTVLMVLPNLISVVLSILAILFVVKTEALYMGRIVPTAVVNILFGFLICIWVYKKSNLLHSIKYLNYGLKISAPLVLHGIALIILSQSDRIMISWFADESQTGIYSLIYNFSMLATVITTSLEGVWVPWFMLKYKENQISQINKMVVYYDKLMSITMIGLVLIGPEVIHILSPEKYWEGISIIPPVVLANYLIFLYTLYVNVEHFHKKTPYITVNTIISAIINIVLNLIFIPQFGYVAAAYTTLASYFVSLLLHAIYAKRLNKTIYPLKLFIPSLLQIAVATVLFYSMMDYAVLRWGTAIAYIAIITFLNRKKIVELFPSVIKKTNK